MRVIEQSPDPGLRLGRMAAGRWQERVRTLKFAQSRPNDSWSQVQAGRFIASGTILSNPDRFGHDFRICFGLPLANLGAALAMPGELTRQLAEH